MVFHLILSFSSLLFSSRCLILVPDPWTLDTSASEVFVSGVAFSGSGALWSVSLMLGSPLFEIYLWS